jgi:hypothetical protein
MRAQVQAQLAAKLEPKLVHELLEAHSEAKRSFYLGGLRLAEVEGGRFCEAAFRLLELIAFSGFTPLGGQIDTERLIERLRNLDASTFPDAVRLHIPRALRLVYDIRNKRDAAHLADGIDPNVQDGTLVISVLDWVLAEFLRLYHSVSADQAQALVDAIVVRSAPLIQDFSGFLKVLNPQLGATDHCLALLYQRGAQGATLVELDKWARPKMRGNLRRTLSRLVNELDLVHFDGSRYHVTRLGEQEVEARKLVSRD